MLKPILMRLFNVRRDEWPSVLLAVLFFFCVLTALMMLRPAREALGLQRGIEAVRWLFVGTAVITLLVNPVYGALVSRLRTVQVVACTYVFFALSLLGFYLLLTVASDAVGETSGQVFYVWFSVFNLFSTMVFWSLMADRFRLAQSKRCFALIAVGGTLGAIFGPWLASVLVTGIGTPALLLVSAAFLMAGLAAAWGFLRITPVPAHAATDPNRPEQDDDSSRRAEARIGGSAWQGVRAVLRSRYLAGIAAYMILFAVMSTFLYFTRLQMVAGLAEGMDTRTALFARIDTLTQIATFVLQLSIAGKLMQRVGVPVTLALLPLTTALGFVGLALVGTLAALVVFEAFFRAVQRAVMRPARETLFTVVPREDKYKAKAVIDTFIYRVGDVAGAQMEGGLARLGMGLAAVASVAVPLAVVWGVLGMWLGLKQQRLAVMAAPDGEQSSGHVAQQGVPGDAAAPDSAIKHDLIGTRHDANSASQASRVPARTR